jgi:hypothetical protein
MQWDYLGTTKADAWVPCIVCGRHFPDHMIPCGDIMYCTLRDFLRPGARKPRGKRGSFPIMLVSAVPLSRPEARAPTKTPGKPQLTV